MPTAPPHPLQHTSKTTIRAHLTCPAVRAQRTTAPRSNWRQGGIRVIIAVEGMKIVQAKWRRREREHGQKTEMHRGTIAVEMHTDKTAAETCMPHPIETCATEGGGTLRHGGEGAKLSHRVRGAALPHISISLSLSLHGVYYSVLQCACSVLQCVAVCCIVWRCVAVCCSVFQCAAVCCNVLQCFPISRALPYRLYTVRCKLHHSFVSWLMFVRACVCVCACACVRVRVRVCV